MYLQCWSSLAVKRADAVALSYFHILKDNCQYCHTAIIHELLMGGHSSAGSRSRLLLVYTTCKTAPPKGVGTTPKLQAM